MVSIVFVKSAETQLRRSSMAEEKLYYCEKCRKAMKRENFYASKNTEKYPDGIVHECKQCMTMHVDN